MRPALDWPRFLLAAVGGAVVVFVLDILFHGTLAAGLYAGYPQRPMGEIQALFPFLFATYIVHLTLFVWLYLRLYPGRGAGAAVWWGLWGGFFVVIPNMQFFVAVRDTSWFLLGVQVAEGIALCVVMALLFELTYRPRHG